MSDADLKEKEAAGIDPKAFENEFGKGFSDDEKSRLDALSKDVGNNTSRIAISRRQKGLIGGATGLLIGGGFGFFTIISGPLQFIHIAQLLQGFHFSNQEDAGDDRMMKITRYIRNRETPNRTRMGALGNAMADRIETKMNKSGIESAYTQRGQYYDGYRIDPNNIPDGSPLEDMKGKTPEEFRAALSERLGIDPAKIDLTHESGKIHIRGDDLGYFEAKKLVRVQLEEAGYSKLGAAIRARIMGKRAGIDWHPMKKLDRKANEKISDLYNRWREEREKRMNGDIEEDITGSNAAQEDPDGDGKPTTDPDAASAKPQVDETIGLANEANAEAATGHVPASEGALHGLRTHVATKIAGGVSAAIGIICTIKAISDNIDQIKHLNVVMPLMRMGMEAVTVGNQVMSGNDVDMQQLAFFAKNLNDPETGSWAAARSIQAELGQKQLGPDMRDEAQVKTEKNFISQFIDGIPGVGGVCKAANSVVGQVVSFGIDLLGGPVTAISGAVFGATVAPKILDALTNWLAGHPISLDVAGADYGNYINYGARLAANDSAIAGGGRALSTAESAELRQDHLQQERQEVQYASLSDRIFNPYKPYSLFSRFIDQQNPDAMEETRAIARMPLHVFSSFGGLFSSFLPKASAASGSYDYGFDEYGFSANELSNPSTRNPYENASRVVEIFKDNDKYNMYHDRVDKCFGMQIERNGEATSKGEVPPYYQMPDSCKSTDEEWLAVRLSIFDTQLLESTACYEGVEDSCARITGSASTGSANTPGSLGISPDGFVFPLKTSKQAIINNAASKWCYQNQNNCHHDYNAADIFQPTGTIVVAARGGRVVASHDHDSSAVGSRVTIKGEDGNLYYYAHMGDGTIKVSEGQTVIAGTELGQVGTRADAMGTDTHLHFDILPSTYSSRPGCSGAECTAYPFINPQPILISAFNALP